MHYLTIRPVALEGEGSNCFSITQLVGQKKAIIKKKQLQVEEIFIWE